MRFMLPKFDPFEKYLELDNDDIRLLVDFDDVNHYEVEELTKLIIDKLNTISKEEWDAALLRAYSRREE